MASYSPALPDIGGEGGGVIVTTTALTNTTPVSVQYLETTVRHTLPLYRKLCQYTDNALFNVIQLL